MPSTFLFKLKSSAAVKSPMSGLVSCPLPTTDNNFRDGGDKLWMNVPVTPPPLPSVPPVPETPNRQVSRSALHKSTTATEIVALYQDRGETMESVPAFNKEDECQAGPLRPSPRATVSQYSLSQYSDDEIIFCPSDYGDGTEPIPEGPVTYHPKPMPHATGTDLLSRSMSRYHKRAPDQQSLASRSNVAAIHKPLSSHSSTLLSYPSQGYSIETSRNVRVRADDAWDLKVQQRFWMHHQTMRINAKDLLKREKVLKSVRKEQKERNKRNMFDITWSPRKSVARREEP